MKLEWVIVIPISLSKSIGINLSEKTLKLKVL